MPTTIAVPVSWQLGSTPPAAIDAFRKQLEGDEPIVVRRLGIVEDRSQLCQVTGPQEVRDVAHRLGCQQGQDGRIDLEELASRGFDGAHAVAGEKAVRGVVMVPGGEHVLVLEVDCHRLERYRRMVRA